MAEGDAVDITELDDVDAFTGPDRYIRTAEVFLGVSLTTIQERIFRAVAEHQRVYVQSGNGVGKSFAAAALNLAFLTRHPESICMATSGTYSVLVDVLWKPMRRLHSGSDLPGRALESPPRIQFDDEWYFKAVSPRHPGALEGRHASGGMLVTLEEVDKPDITQDHFDSAESMLTGSEDRILAIGNPPKDETNVAYELQQSDRWHTVQFSSFDSHNVRVDAGEIEADRIPGLVGLNTVRDDWENWNGGEWPGIDAARTAHKVNDSLDERWFRRRCGTIPPASAAAHRPFDVATVQAAAERSATEADEAPDAVGIDVARSGDRTVMAAVHGDVLRIHYSEQGTDHRTQTRRLRALLDDFLGADIAVDAVGEGSGLADTLEQSYDDVERFKAGAEAGAAETYRDCWTEGLAELGSFLEEGSFDDDRLREELLAAGRTVEYDETYLSGRGPSGADVLDASSKTAVKDRLGRSPDHLDAALMAAWAANADTGFTVTPETAFSFEI